MLALAFAAVPLALIMLQPDLGTALVVGVIVLGVLAVSGAPTALGRRAGRWARCWSRSWPCRLGVLKDYQLDRFTGVRRPDAPTRKGAGYNVRQARIAIGSGGLLGQGLFHGAQTKGQFVPEQQTDFVFTVAGEELGFVGAGVHRRCCSASCSGGPAGSRCRPRTCSAGWSPPASLCWFAFQAFENIGMTLGIMPVTGLPLPFVSYGGSSMFANMLAVGLLQNVHMRRYT